ncbi:hypothetical protein B0T11DRAFT_296454 [Plectosphaerella cucumerina]|uniref:Uncharacterized protein n=1 Tax=Plectosphaerella cucumerina TaxID=40658 RepID=A0A8K0TNS5_9PEZI|nr:hypothetical protein B0T11DRAFT_296454 [Plectosphaerella cucumerina]
MASCCMCRGGQCWAATDVVRKRKLDKLKRGDAEALEEHEGGSCIQGSREDATAYGRQPPWIQDAMSNGRTTATPKEHGPRSRLQAKALNGVSTRQDICSKEQETRRKIRLLPSHHGDLPQNSRAGFRSSPRTQNIRLRDPGVYDEIRPRRSGPVEPAAICRHVEHCEGRCGGVVLKLVHSVTDVIDGPLQPNGRDETLSQGRRAAREGWQLRARRPAMVEMEARRMPARWRPLRGRGVVGDGVRFEKAMVAETADSCREGRDRCFEASRLGIVHDGDDLAVNT